jgi:hypothetical protein
MFENFKQLRSSNSDGLGKLKQNDPHQENMNPNGKYYINDKPRIPKHGKESKRQSPKRGADLPPQYSTRRLDKQMLNDFKLGNDQFMFNSGGTMDSESFTSTFRENEYFVNLNQ